MWFIIAGAIIVVLGAAFLFIPRVMMGMSYRSGPEFWQFAARGIEKRYKGVYPQGKIIFYGSSFIQFWSGLKEDMEPLEVLNHGIAGIRISDATFYFDRLIKPFEPGAVVLYAGSNDINEIRKYTKTGEQTARETEEFFKKVRGEMPDTPIYYIAIAPTPLRWHVWNEVKKANALIKDYIDKSGDQKFKFIDSTQQLLGDTGKPKRGIYRMDRLHFNRKGYEIWKSVIKPVLVKDFVN